MTLEGFWQRVNTNGPIPAHRTHLGPCWLWMGEQTSKGYGLINWPHLAELPSGRKVRKYTHRFSYELHHNVTVSPDLVVCHDCDNPSCVNPKHLFVGTKAQNSADMKAKGRSTWGERNPSAILRESQVRRIKRMLRTGKTRRDIADTFNVTYDTIKAIHRGLNWAYVQ